MPVIIRLYKWIIRSSAEREKTFHQNESYIDGASDVDLKNDAFEECLGLVAVLLPILTWKTCSDLLPHTFHAGDKTQDKCPWLCCTQRWVFKDYSNQHSDLRRHENQFPCRRQP